MEHVSKQSQPVMKISPQFKARLSQLSPNQRIRAIVMLRVAGSEHRQEQRKRGDRKRIVEFVRKSATDAMRHIDGILELHSGKLLTETPDALGSILVETTADGIIALADSEYVKTILEDQPISSLSKLTQA